MTTYPLLDTINHPARLRELTVEQLPVLAEELRRFLIESVAQTGGHLSSNLGIRIGQCAADDHLVDHGTGVAVGQLRELLVAEAIDQILERCVGHGGLLLGISRGLSHRR